LDQSPVQTRGQIAVQINSPDIARWNFSDAGSEK